MTAYIPITLTPKQAIFLNHPAEEGLFGGAAGGGKSDGLLAGALQFVDVPDYHALLLRRTYADLALPGALIERAHGWLDGTDARFDKQRYTWRFPSGATITFGYLEHKGDARRYKGTDFQYIGIDELTEVPWKEDYDYLHSRLRRSKGMAVPLRMRCATNPGGPGHYWVKELFVESTDPERIFIPALLTENPYIDQEAYTKSLMKLAPILREMFLHGSWEVVADGEVFKREWWPIRYDYPREMRWVRYWDLAATEGKGDFSVGLLLGEQSGKYWVVDIKRVRESSASVEKLIRQTAQIDGAGVKIVMEQEGGASGKSLIDHYRRDVLRGFAFYGNHPTGSKLVRAMPVSAAAEAGNVVLVKGPNANWLEDFLFETSVFPGGPHDDIVDALSGAFGVLSPGANSREVRLSEAIPPTRSIPSFGYREDEIPGF